MKVVCINDSNRPTKISESEWIKKDEQYTVIEVAQMGLQAGKLGYKLKEVSLSKKSFPYEYYDAHRFAIFANAPAMAEKVEEADLMEV